MEAKEKTMITVQVIINASPEVVWQKWTSPEDIVRWNHASVDWQTTWAKNDLHKGGKFTSRMEPKDGSAGFDFEGIYDVIKVNEYIEYHLEDGRKVTITFTADNNDQQTKVVETFDPETINPFEMQQTGWQAILDNFRKYVETGQ